MFYNVPPKEHLTAKGFPGFVVEFNTYNIPEVKSPVAYHSLAGRTSLLSLYKFCYQLPSPYGLICGPYRVCTPKKYLQYLAILSMTNN